MEFSVIYTVDTHSEVDIEDYLPSELSLFEETEDDDQFQYSYLEGGWEKGSHRKLCAVLTRKQFENFLLDTGLFPEDIETMGSLGAPGFGPYLVPAVSFRNDDYHAIQGAYVTPIPNIEVKSGISNRQESFDRIKKAMLSVFDL